MEKARRVILTGMLSLCITLMQLAGWQISMKYGTSLHGSAFLQRIGVLQGWQCVLWGILEFSLLYILFFIGFSKLEQRAAVTPAKQCMASGRIWILGGVALFLVYLCILAGCYPGLYNYDVNSQITQVLYREVPYSAHHPVLHTLIEGGIVLLGYQIYPVDLSFGVFLYCAFQMLVCAACFAYSLRFVYRITGKKWLTALAFCFYAFCPPIVMSAMSTTKDILCYTMLLVAVIRIFEIYRKIDGQPIKVIEWITVAAPLTLSCLFRNNIIYGIIVYAILMILLVRQNRKAQIFLYGGVVILYFVINQGLIWITDASSVNVIEALSVPFQQTARLYKEKGEDAFTDQELELLYALAGRDYISYYDPFISDDIKFAFRENQDILTDRKWEFAALWIKKGIQYPGIYLAAFLDNTYQAWYPWTVVIESDGFRRYFLVPDWRETDGTPLLPGLYDYYKGLNDRFSYGKYPVVRLLFTTGTMVWVNLIAFFYGRWRKSREITVSLGLVLLVSATSLLGPVSDVRYYLILFYMLPICIAYGYLSERK